MRLRSWLIRATSWLVPRVRRDEWRREWEAELFHEDARLELRRQFHQPASTALVRRASGALRDALWLRAHSAHTVRWLVRHWPLTSVAVVSLGAALAAVFVGLGVFNAVVLRAPRVARPEELLTLWVRTPQESHQLVSYPEYLHYRDRNGVFTDVAAIPQRIQNVAFVDGDQQITATAAFGSSNLFDVLGIRPALGRLTFPPDIDASADTAILSHVMWTRLGADPAIVGRSVRIGRHQVQIIGVAPRDFGGMMLVFEPDVWMPLKTMQALGTESMAGLANRDQRMFGCVGRLRPGVDAATANADVATLSAQLATAFPATDADRVAFLTPLRVIWDDTRADVVPLAALVMSGLLVALVAAAANVTNVLASLAGLRRQDLVIRAALGASRANLIRQMLRESVVLALAAGVVAFVVAEVALDWLSAARLEFGGLPRIAVDVHLDAPAIAVIAAVVVGVGLLTGVLPAFKASSDAMGQSLNRYGVGAGSGRARLRNALVVVQVAAVTAVFIGIGWSLRSVTNLQAVDPGFAVREAVVVDLAPEPNGYRPTETRRFIDDARSRIASLPGVEAISIADGVPLGDIGWGADRVRPEPATGPRADLDDVRFSVVDPAYFSTLNVRLVTGRPFAAADTAGTPEVVLVNQTMARRYWPDQDPVGRRVFIQNGRRVATVIGVVGDGRYSSLDEVPSPFMYYAFAQHPDGLQFSLAIIARTGGPADQWRASIARTVRAIDPLLEFKTSTLEDYRKAALLFPRFTLACVTAFGVIALLLASVGLFSAVFHAVSQRRHEIGIRVALGALPGDLFRLALVPTAGLAGFGAAIGVGGALLVLPVVSSLFFGVRAFDLALAGAVLMATSGLAVAAAYAAARPWMRAGAVQLLRE